MSNSATPLVAPLPGAEPGQDTVAQAAEWHVRLQSDDASDADRLSCENWRGAHPSHALAFARMGDLWRRFDRARDLPRAAVARSLGGEHQAKARRSPARVALLGTALVAVYFAFANEGMPALSWALADYHTRVGEQRTISLVDGSSVTLNTDSAIDVSYDATQRRVRLLRGEIIVGVSKDSARPFIIETAHGTALALGTQYTVRHDDEATTVTVIESSVRACSGNANAQPEKCTDLVAGQRARIRAGAIEGPEPIDATTAASWTQGMLLIDDRPLIEVLHELERYRSGWIGFDAEALRHLRVSGVFPLHDTDRALSLLATTQPIALNRYGALYVRVDAR